jgi:hypothetical protein
MKRIRLLLLLVLLMSVATSLSAQTSDNGKTVRRITFDQENISIEYTDGTKDENVQNTVVYGSNFTTGIQSIDDSRNDYLRFNRDGSTQFENGISSNNGWYDMQGRKVNRQSGQLRNGLYIVREGQNTRVTVIK